MTHSSPLPITSLPSVLLACSHSLAKSNAPPPSPIAGRQIKRKADADVDAGADAVIVVVVVVVVLLLLLLLLMPHHCIPPGVICNCIF